MYYYYYYIYISISTPVTLFSLIYTLARVVTVAHDFSIRVYIKPAVLDLKFHDGSNLMGPNTLFLLLFLICRGLPPWPGRESERIILLESGKLRNSLEDIR